ncbi:nucleotide sugar dehydrogenase [Paucidesulfovibrio gracilis]|uniref:nucleotide sugar dehydrogenase n=1 Tax=Paucidesulfovibrio gracilis TaxID=47158 RepID=UPI00099B15F7|nr:nucleotide sugar dehydrogenase [Paucidesulfovibrio gracilis]
MITFDELKARKAPIAVVGLGYVGLPLAVALSRHFDVIGFDICEQRIRELQDGKDRTNEVLPHDLQSATVRYSHQAEDLAEARVIIVAVPTPIDDHRSPDLRPVRGSSTTVGQHLQPGTVVVYESTVYPGLTEDICVPLLEEHSGLTCGKDFFVGYSPERINPGDREHTLQTIVKVVAGQNDASTDLLAELYGSVVTAGVYRAADIKTAEAAKVIENTQRDLNIALMNELATIFDRMGIDTLNVLEAAGTKWNFLPFRPGLVGGHCIGVDPYYLTFKAQALGLHPQLILAGRRINDTMGKFIVENAIKWLINADKKIKNARIGMLGLTFKENVPDLRNTKAVDIVHEFEEYGARMLVHDAMADHDEAKREYDIDLSELEELRDLDCLVLCVSHDAYRELELQEIKSWFRDQKQPIIIDVKGFFDPEELKEHGFLHWRL